MFSFFRIDVFRDGRKSRVFDPQTGFLKDFAPRAFNERFTEFEVPARRRPSPAFVRTLSLSKKHFVCAENQDADPDAHRLNRHIWTGLQNALKPNGTIAAEFNQPNVKV